MDFINAHWTPILLALFWLYSAVVSNMPAPDSTTSRGYAWLFGTLHTLAGNLNNTFAGKLPTAKLIAVLVLLPLMFVLPACHGYQIHPGAPDTAASKSYDSLLAAKGAIDTAKAQIASGQLSVEYKPVVNGAVRSYNLAKRSLQVYSDAVTKGQPSSVYLQVLTTDIVALEAKILALKGGK